MCPRKSVAASLSDKNAARKRRNHSSLFDNFSVPRAGDLHGMSPRLNLRCLYMLSALQTRSWCVHKLQRCNQSGGSRPSIIHHVTRRTQIQESGVRLFNIQKKRQVLSGRTALETDRDWQVCVWQRQDNNEHHARTSCFFYSLLVLPL